MGGKRKTRLTSPELWEIKQLIAAGVMDPSQLPDFDEENGVLDKAHELEEELDIEVRVDEPSFLRGQTSKAINLSPVKVVKVPDGSMNRAAMAGIGLAKERKELRHQQEEQLASMPSGNVEESGDAGAPVLRIPTLPSTTEPEWKRKMFGAATSFGKRTSLSMKEQRESLPVFKLRSSLISAVTDNQVLVVIGDTGETTLPISISYLY
jgi:ATP-dependent RNA helicase DHX8/PRP22